LAQVNARGTVRERMAARIQRNERGCWIWTAANNGRYGVLYAWGRMRYAHRVSYREFKGEIPAGHEIRHHCDSPLCVNPDHLTTGTHRQNVDDAVRRDRTSNGDRCPTAKLTRAQVERIRERNPLTEVDIAATCKEYGVTRRTIYRAIRGETWVGPGAPTRVPEPEWIPVGHPETRHVTRATDGTLPHLLSQGYVRIPDDLWRAARNKLARHPDNYVSLRSTKKLAQWLDTQRAA
jgi:hypothetical protein